MYVVGREGRVKGNLREGNNSKFGSPLNWQDRKTTETLCFAKNLQKFRNIFEKICSLHVFFCNSAESRRRSVMIKRFPFCFQLHPLQAGLSTMWTFRSVLRTKDLTAGKCSKQETCELIFFACWPHPKQHILFFFWYFWCEEHKASRSHSSSPSFPLKRPTWCIYFTAAVRWMWTGQNTDTSYKCPRFVGCVCVCVCVCVCGQLFYFRLRECSVSVLFWPVYCWPGLIDMVVRHKKFTWAKWEK